MGTDELLSQLNAFSKLLHLTMNQFISFKELVECRDATIFMSIPNLLIVQSIRDSKPQSWQEICERFAKGLIFKDSYNQAKMHIGALNTPLTETLYMQILELDQNSKMLPSTGCVRQAGMDLARESPAAWNEFVTVSIGDDE